ncbi:archease [Nostoc sp. LEGE 12447]|uniref:archease n=1 Tax=Nostoc sp. LEGE 12447 TaxID=1828640 RepID=UPI001883A90A|nr:archease [Nostoc sp. LEGE 12447]MBE8998862.1 archease [Nostoc sp. LEGE 12447]
MKSVDLINLAGFQEVEHTADWAYRVWGRNLTQLFIQAAIALYYLGSIFFHLLRIAAKNSNFKFEF